MRAIVPSQTTHGLPKLQESPAYPDAVGPIYCDVGTRCVSGADRDLLAR